MNFFPLKLSRKFSSCLAAPAVQQHKILQSVYRLIKESSKTICSEEDSCKAWPPVPGPPDPPIQGASRGLS